MNSVFIRPASPTDAEMIADFSHRSFYDAFASFNTKANMDKFMRTDFSKERIMAQVCEPGNIFLLAFADSEFSGYGRLLEGENPPEFGGVPAIEISRIYVDHKITSRGIGSALMQRSIEIALEKNKKMIWLGVWELNTKAILFYQRFGFEIFGKHIFMLGDDAQTDLLMKRAI